MSGKTIKFIFYFAIIRTNLMLKSSQQFQRLCGCLSHRIRGALCIFSWAFLLKKIHLINMFIYICIPRKAAAFDVRLMSSSLERRPWEVYDCKHNKRRLKGRLVCINACRQKRCRTLLGPASWNFVTVPLFLEAFFQFFINALLVALNYREALN